MVCSLATGSGPHVETVKQTSGRVPAPRRFHPAPLIAFTYLWITLGFFAGTLVLNGPVRWLTSALRARDAAQHTEDLVVRGTIVLLLLGTGWLAWGLVRRMWRPSARRARWTAPGASTVLAIAALALWMNPRMLTGASEPIPSSTERFVFGPYPTPEILAELKQRGFTGVIALLHPAVVPFEPRLLAQERAAASRAGITLIEAPMLPWVSDNAASIERIRSVARSGEGRYYVHCYLGKDRVNVVRRLLQDMDASVVAAGAGGGARRIADQAAFERGKIHHLTGPVHVTPFPTDEEWMGYILAGDVRQVLSLLDTTSAADARWADKERQMTHRYRMPVEFAPIATSPYDPQSAVHAATRARALPRPLVVHEFRTASAATEAFIQAYRTGLPPLPPSLFREPMKGGAVRVLGANVAAGPRPSGPEFGGYLHRRGVRGIIFLGSSDTPGARREREIAESVHLQWHTISGPGPELDSVITRGGPWYLYGPALERTAPVLDARLDPGVP